MCVCVCVCVCSVASDVSDSLQPMDSSLPGSSAHGDFPGKNTGVGYRALLQGIFLTRGLNPCLFMSPALAGRFFATSATWEAYIYTTSFISIHLVMGLRQLEREVRLG